MQPFDFSGKTVFVSGGTSGIGLGIAAGFADKGARIAVMSRKQDKVDAAVARLEALGAQVLGFAADVRDFDAVSAAMQATSETFGAIDVLVSGAAGNFPAPACQLSSNAFKTVVEIDLLGSFHVLRAAFDYLQKPGACVINISAPQAFLPMTMQMHACAAKSGVDMVTRVAAMEWGAAGVRVNSIVPGPIAETEGMARLAPTAEMEERIAASVPLKRYGEKQEIADACLWLASPMASYVTGVVLPVDGGWSLTGASL